MILRNHDTLNSGLDMYEFVILTGFLVDFPEFNYIIIIDNNYN